jgi:hypothetical protein
LSAPSIANTYLLKTGACRLFAVGWWVALVRDFSPVSATFSLHLAH